MSFAEIDKVCVCRYIKLLSGSLFNLIFSDLKWEFQRDNLAKLKLRISKMHASRLLLLRLISLYSGDYDSLYIGDNGIK